MCSAEYCLLSWPSNIFFLRAPTPDTAESGDAPRRPSRTRSTLEGHARADVIPQSLITLPLAPQTCTQKHARAADLTGGARCGRLTLSRARGDADLALCGVPLPRRVASKPHGYGLTAKGL